MQRANARKELVALYRELGDQILDTTVQERVFLTIAKESYGLGDRDTARDYYRRVLDSSSEHLVALEALEKIYGEGREFEQLLEIFARRAELAMRSDRRDDAERRHYLLSAADLCERELGRSDEAIVSLEAVLQLFPRIGKRPRVWSGCTKWPALGGSRRPAGAPSALCQRRCRDRRSALPPGRAVRKPSCRVLSARSKLSSGDRCRSAPASSITALERFLNDLDLKLSAAGVLKPVYELIWATGRS